MSGDEDKCVNECCRGLATRVAYSAVIDKISNIIKDFETMKHEWQRGYEAETGRPHKELKPSPPPFLDTEAGEYR